MPRPAASRAPTALVRAAVRDRAGGPALAPKGRHEYPVRRPPARSALGGSPRQPINSPAGFDPPWRSCPPCRVMNAHHADGRYASAAPSTPRARLGELSHAEPGAACDGLPPGARDEGFHTEAVQGSARPRATRHCGARHEEPRGVMASRSCTVWSPRRSAAPRSPPTGTSSCTSRRSGTTAP